MLLLLALVTNQHRQNEVLSYHCMQSSKILVSSAEFLYSPSSTGGLSGICHPEILPWYCL